MDTALNNAAIEKLIDAINRGDHEALNGVFTDDVVIEWPQSGERIRGERNRREIYSRFPSLPHITSRRITVQDDLRVLEANLNYDGDEYQCVFIFRLRGDQIAQEIGYWAKPFPAQEWRAPWVEKM